jgi:hypothetical protein
MRELFVAAVFEKSLDEYNKSGNYKRKKRSLYSTPFIEAVEVVKPCHKDISAQFQKLIEMSADIFKFQKPRNEIIHEIATAIGRRERELLNRTSNSVTEKLEENFSSAESKQLHQHHEAAHKKQISDTIRELTKWYSLLVTASNEVFIIENTLRRVRAC